ncbi:hypothetical protein AVO41_01220 [Thiomicrospira sp. WB1]|nr:hypothetical protein AVO41_01220 [Thiomicrospira sp. WB1]
MLWFMALSVLVFMLAFSSAHAQDKTPIDQSVGTVQFKLGKDSILVRNNDTSPIKDDLKLYEGDVIQTGPTGHVHIKFNDQALVSIRPNSQLEIECYKTQGPSADWCMRLNLHRGTIRKVSGQAGQQHKDKFRLNTPIAAIGIRGTDFVTQANAKTSLVRVIEGAVAIAPFDEHCLPNKLGECQTHLTKALRASDPFMLKVSEGLMPTEVPIDDNVLVANNTPQAAEKGHKNGNTPKTQAHQVASILADHPGLVKQFLALNEEKLSQDSFDREPAQSLDMLYGSWSQQGSLTIYPYELAKLDKEITVGNNKFALWRKTGEYHPTPGVGQFSLAQAQISTSDGYMSDNLNISKSRLAVNFDTNELETHLQIDRSLGDSVLLNAYHKMTRDDGIFAFTTTEGNKIAGALSNDGQHAGYIFDHFDQQGHLNVRTLWENAP